MMSEIKEVLGPVLRVLKELGGRFIFRDDEGRQFVLAAQEEWEKLQEKPAEMVQRPLPLANVPAARPWLVRSRADELLDRINREIAMFQNEQSEEEVVLAVPEELAPTTDDLGVNDQAPLRVKFEPLKGDLPPELQA